jgi:hypothetical protein
MDFVGTREGGNLGDGLEVWIAVFAGMTARLAYILLVNKHFGFNPQKAIHI